MKKMLPSTVLALVVSGVLAAPSFAGCCFGLIPHHGCCGCCGCGTQFCVRQYNAFSPVCCGTVYCDGCSPFGPPGCGYGGGCGMGGAGCGLPFSGTLGGCCGPQGCAEGACLGSLPAADATIGVPGAPTTPAAPLPTGASSQLVNDRAIQNTTYRPASYTLPSTPSPVAPRQMQPQMMAAPSYWGN